MERLVDAFDLGPYLDDQRRRSLPLGFKQRLALACAVLHDPPVLFLDEPTSGVDPLTRREFWSHINAMVERGVTVLVTTHFLDEAEYCDRIALVYKGRVIASGTPDELKDRGPDRRAPRADPGRRLHRARRGVRRPGGGGMTGSHDRQRSAASGP